MTHGLWNPAALVRRPHPPLRCRRPLRDGLAGIEVTHPIAGRAWSVGREGRRAGGAAAQGRPAGARRSRRSRASTPDRPRIGRAAPGGGPGPGRPRAIPSRRGRHCCDRSRSIPISPWPSRFWRPSHSVEARSSADWNTSPRPRRSIRAISGRSMPSARCIFARAAWTPPSRAFEAALLRKADHEESRIGLPRGLARDSPSRTVLRPWSATCCGTFPGILRSRFWRPGMRRRWAMPARALTIRR